MASVCETFTNFPASWVALAPHALTSACRETLHRDHGINQTCNMHRNERSRESRWLAVLPNFFGCRRVSQATEESYDDSACRVPYA